jgi:protein-disulfide isomerase
MLTLLVSLCVISGCSPNTLAQNEGERPVATAGDTKFYERDYLPKIQGEIYKLRKQEYDLKRRALEEAINRKLVADEAKRRGLTEADLVRQEADSKVPEPPANEIEETYVQQLFRGSAQITKDQVKEQMMRAGLQEARQQYFQALREKAGVEIDLPLPRADVGYNSARVRGNANAPVTIVEFSDFRCPFCLRAYVTVKNLLEKYDGKVKLAYRDLPLLEMDSALPGSAEAARCAEEQGKFWEYHDLLFENQTSGETAYRKYAEIVGLDNERFNACMKSGKFKGPIQEDFAAGIGLGITGTPSFFINGIMITGAQPQSVFEQVIDQELARLNRP